MRDDNESYLNLLAGGGWTCVVPEDEPRIDAAVSRHIDHGDTGDTLLLLTMVSGESLKLRASEVREWYLSTPEGRRRSMVWESERREEEDALKHELGIWEP